MKPSSFRRKWTSIAVVGGLLVSGVASAPAWGQRDTSDINDEIEETDANLTAAVEEYNQLAQEAQDNRDMIAQTQESLDAAEADLDALRQQLADYLTATYVDQGIGDAALLLESGSPDAFVERLDRLNSANLYNFDLLDELKTASEEYTVQLDLLEDLQADLDEQEADLEQQQDELNARMADLEEEWQAAAGDAITDYDLPYMTDDEYAVVSFALDQVGKQYVWGTAGPDTYDCSGLVLRAYAQIGIELPHNAAAQYGSTASISRDELQPGDLVFYNDLSHMGMYIGNGLIVHAPNSRTVVKVVELDHGNVWYGATTILH
ncbi:NlpC/P60 family protein [Glycomyces algeriensis]|uniref:C40 family peptidase n=1 Tax=Glycomyces algeriensis TaxID=256037 RepID=UPI0022D93924|nr:C40 family peptidase [Glycomyces algeriensis]MDA1368600.1 NlpC/P60 family protein [Glycomyces algeriensis]MDR7352399.1 Skp family chaperone for outer membrane proteins [Glycomyces algeriensis]